MRFLPFLIALILIATPISSVYAQTVADEITTYQKLKNVTRGDTVGGQTTTVGWVGDRVHFLIFVQNTDVKARDFIVTDLLPNGLTYAAGSAKYYKYQQGEWRDLAGNSEMPLRDYRLHLAADEWIFITLRTDITFLPESNVTLSNIVRINRDDGTTITQTATRILAPNARVKDIAATPTVARELTAEEKKLLDEEFRFIEAAWDRELTTPVKTETKNETTTRTLWPWITGAFILLTSTVYVIHRTKK